MKQDQNNPSLKLNAIHFGFRIKAISYLEKLNNTLYQLAHEKTGAQMIHLSNSDDNNCFSVAFKTTPSDSTGVAHILEHTALCGSNKFPVRDPFFSMIKKSMNTFMNAFTASDWTMYPFSTQNEVDFFNLMSVYLDAAFFPTLTELNFKQEGHRLEFTEPENPSSDLQYKGVVFNEMKGAMASPGRVLSYEIGKKLFPTVTYKYNSGGDPEDIVNLSHQQLVDFHKTHYHPSNSYFYTYGNIPLIKNLEYIDNHVLSKFDKIDIQTMVPNEKRFGSPKESVAYYPLNKAEDDGQKNHVALAWLTCNIKDPIEVLSLQIINLVLLGHSGAPLKKKLLESNLGKALTDSTGLDDEIKEPYFSVGLQGVANENIERVEKLILDSLNEIATSGISQDQIETAIHQMELDTREISGGHFPYSLNLLFRFFGAWIHGGDPQLAVDFDALMLKIKENLRTPGYLENQIRKYLIDNHHHVKVVLKPNWELENQRETKIKKQLHEIKTGLSEAETETIISETKALKKHQEQIEDLSCLPSLKVADIPEKQKYVNCFKTIDNPCQTTYYDSTTNGIFYSNLYFKIDHLSDEERIWLPLIGYLLPNVGVDGLNYEALSNLINRYTGGIGATIGVEKRLAEKNKLVDFFSISGKCLYENIPRLFDIISQILNKWDYSDTERIKTLIAQRTNSLLNSIVEAGHSYASMLAGSGLSASGQIDEIYSGIKQIQFMKNLTQMTDTQLKQEIDRLNQLLNKIFTINNLSILVISDQSEFKTADQEIVKLTNQLKTHPGNTSEKEVKAFNVIYHRASCLVTTPVSYVAQSYKTAPYAHPDCPVLTVLATLIKSCFIHAEIREKGGAYGGMTGYSADEGVFTFVSYRDPHFARTLSVYGQTLDWLRSGKFTDQDVSEAILQTCSRLDTPLSPAGKAMSEYIFNRKGKSRNLREEFRAGILKCTKEQLIDIGSKWLSTDFAIASVSSEEIVAKNKADIANFNITPFRL